MPWRDARAKLAEALKDVAITEPVEQKVERVYESPPSTVQDVPCFIIYPPAVKVTRGPSGRRTKLYTVRCRLLARDADAERASDVVDAYREALIDRLDAEITLAQNVSVSDSQDIEEAAGFTYAGTKYIGFDALLKINMTEGRSFS